MLMMFSQIGETFLPLMNMIICDGSNGCHGDFVKWSGNCVYGDVLYNQWLNTTEGCLRALRYL